MNQPIPQRTLVQPDDGVDPVLELLGMAWYWPRERNNREVGQVP